MVVLTNKIRLLQGKPACEKELSMAYCVSLSLPEVHAFKKETNFLLVLFSLHLKQALLDTE